MLLLSVPAFAADKIELEQPTVSDNLITVTGKVSAPEAKIYVEIVRKGADLLDKKNVYAMKQAAADKSGSFSIVCEMPENDRNALEKSVDGYFTVYAFSAGFESDELDFSYIKKSTAENFFKALNEAKDSESKLLAFFADENNKLMLDTYKISVDEFNSFPADVKNKGVAVLKNMGLTFDENNISQINEMIIAMLLNNISDSEGAKALLETEDIASRTELSSGGVEYKDADEKVKTSFQKRIAEKAANNEFEAVSELNALYKEVYALCMVNETHYSKLFDVLKKYKSELKLENCSEFSTLESAAAAVCENVMQRLKAKSDNITTVEDLHGLIKQAYSDYLASLSSGGGGGGGKNPSKDKGSNSLGVGSIPSTSNNETKTDTDNKEYFGDLSAYSWAKEAVNKLAAADVVSGDGNGSFSPERYVTRAEFLKMLLSALDLAEEGAACSFEDVAASDWCYKYIAAAFEKGITSGVSDTHFGKNNLITRQEAAVFMHRAAVRVYIPLDGEANEAFADEGDIAGWAKRSVNIMKNAGFISGVGENRFNPNGNTTRAEAAVMIYNLYKAMQ